MKIIGTEGIPPQILAAMYAKMNTYRDDKTAYMQQHPEVEEEFSVTTLAKSPRQVQLVKRHWDEIEVQAMDLYYILMGSVLHSILEQHPNPNDRVEYRYGYTFTLNGKKIHVHGMADVVNILTDAFLSLSQGVIEDWKYTSMSAMNYEKSDYIKQVNLLRLLLGKDRHSIKTLRNIFIFRDWRSADVKAGRSKQPMFCKVVEHPIWSDEDALAYLKARIIAHTSAINIPDDDLPECTREELWYSKDGFRIRRKTKAKSKNVPGDWSKRTDGWTETEAEAHAIATTKGLTEYRLEPTTGSPKKCAYCDAKPFCNQYARMNPPSAEQIEQEEQDNLPDL